MSVETDAPPKGTIWRKASELKPGDQVATDNGRFIRIKRIDRANWIKTAEGYCVWIFYADGSDQVASKSDEYAIRA